MAKLKVHIMCVNNTVHICKMPFRAMFPCSVLDIDNGYTFRLTISAVNHEDITQKEPCEYIKTALSDTTVWQFSAMGFAESKTFQLVA